MVTFAAGPIHEMEGCGNAHISQTCGGDGSRRSNGTGHLKRPKQTYEIFEQVPTLRRIIYTLAMMAIIGVL